MLPLTSMWCQWLLYYTMKMRPRSTYVITGCHYKNYFNESVKGPTFHFQAHCRPLFCPNLDPKCNNLIGQDSSYFTTPKFQASWQKLNKSKGRKEENWASCRRILRISSNMACWSPKYSFWGWDRPNFHFQPKCLFKHWFWHQNTPKEPVVTWFWKKSNL